MPDLHGVSVVLFYFLIVTFEKVTLLHHESSLCTILNFSRNITYAWSVYFALNALLIFFHSPALVISGSGCRFVLK